MTNFEGQLVAIYVSPVRSAPMQHIESVVAEAGCGLVGDRNHRAGARGRAKPRGEVTLIESEAVAAAVADYGLTFDASSSRRNLVTVGVPLNHLVGRVFRVGSTVLRGIELCEPCSHLEKLTVRGIEEALRHRGGLRAQILEGGTLAVGNTIRLCDVTEHGIE